MVAATESQASSRRERVLAWAVDLLLIAGFVALIYHPLVFTAQTLNAAVRWSDLLALAQPSLIYSGNALVRGELPLWNPAWFAGYPHLAMPSASVFYPTTILFGLLAFPIAIKIVVLLHCYLAGVFSYMLGKSVFDRRVPALYFAFTAVSGDLVLPFVREAHSWSLQTLVWFPLAVLFVHRLCRYCRWGSVVGLAATVTMMVFGGDPQALAFGLLLLAGYSAALLVYGLFMDWPAVRPAVSKGSFCLLGVVLGLGLAGIQLIPSQELYAESVRAGGVAFEYINLGGTPRIMPAFLYPEDEEVWRIVSSNRLLLTLAALGLVLARRPEAWAALIAAAVCALYGTMPRWLYDAVIEHVPVYNGVRGAFRIVGLVGWALAYLSAFGVAVWTRPRDEKNSTSIGAAAVSLGALAILMALPAWNGIVVSPVRLWVCALAAAGMIFALARKRLPFAGTTAAAVIIVATGVELGWRSERFDIAGDPDVYAVNDGYSAFSRARTDLDRMGLVFHPRSLPHGAAVGLLTGDRVLQGYHGLMLARYARILDEVGGLSLAPRDADGRLLGTQNFPDTWISPKMLPVIDLFNVRHIVCVDQRAGFSSLDGSQVRRFRRVEGGVLSVYENTSALPPVYAIHDVVGCATDGDAIEILRDVRFDHHKRITVTGAFNTEGLMAPLAPEPVTIREYSPERIVAEVELSTPAVVVFSEMFYPGWKVYVDGLAREILCVDTAFRGVRAEAGRHTIEMRFEPMSLRIGVLISVTSLIVILAISAGVFLRSRSRVKREGGITPV